MVEETDKEKMIRLTEEHREAHRECIRYIKRIKVKTRKEMSSQQQLEWDELERKMAVPMKEVTAIMHKLRKK